MKVYPVPGRTVRDPVSGVELGTAGLDVDDTDAFWLRRLADVDATKEAPSTAQAVEPEKSASDAAKKGGK